MGAKKKQELKALLFDFGGTLAFLDFEIAGALILARRSEARPRSRSSTLNTRARGDDRHLMSDGNSPPPRPAYEHFLRLDDGSRNS